jgi:hypothetical protein
VKDRTTAEVVLDFYRVVRDTASDLVILGWNTIGHLAARPEVLVPGQAVQRSLGGAE